MWQTVQFVGGGISLVAFIVATAFYAYRERLRNNAAIIRSAPAKDRAEAIATFAEFFRVDVTRLSAKQQATIVLEQLHMRSKREFLYFLSFLIIAIVCAVIALVAIVVDTKPSPNKLACIDAAAQYPETDQTRVEAFTYNATDPNDVHVSSWTRPTPDRWMETAKGKQSYFSIKSRTQFEGCDGTIVTKNGDPTLELLISDKNCTTKGLLFRRAPSCQWIALSPMENVY